MTELQSSELSPVKRALLEIRELRARVNQLETAAKEPIAIVGLSIRAPGGVVDEESFAELLWSGRDAITPIPADRWSLDEWFDENPHVPGKMSTRFGGFIEGVEQFDAEFFGISPREAASMDPQQRLMLELAWEALENAGYASQGFAGRRVGIYLGIANGDYGRALFSKPQLIDPYFSSGNSFSVASGRLAYFLAVQGPAISVDTACSSSLVALHLAAQGLRHGDCDIAIVGGVNLILTPEVNVNFSKAGMMSRDGRCKTFDAAADGYVRGEGGGVVILRRLSDAQQADDRILAVVRGTAVNQDGRSNGLTAPNGPAQEAVIRAAIAAAQIEPASIGYVEAHGTGTPLGDPIEVNALGAVLADGRDAEHPLFIGSVKTNIGHLEAAAGIVGVIKTVIALQRREIPPHLHLNSLNPHVDWEALPISVPKSVTPWTPIAGRRLAGISSFGFSGTNAHVILEEAPQPVDAAHPLRQLQLLVLSARDQQTLQASASRYRAMLAKNAVIETELADICFSAATGRTHLSSRIAIIGENAPTMIAALDAYLRGEPHPALVTGKAHEEPRVAFLFPGQGPQYLDMGRELYKSAPAFREAFDACAEALNVFLKHPLPSVIFADGGNSGLLNETAYAQPAMFAMEVSLAALWRSWGIEPVAVMGHSFGEYAAACIAGAIPLADAARMVAARGRFAQALPRGGAMTVIEASEEAVNQAIARFRSDVAIAAINGSKNVVISGTELLVDQVASEFTAKGLRTKRLKVSHAFHSPLIEPALDDFEREIAATMYSEPAITLISNLSGRVADVALIGRSAYWREHMRQPVRFADSVRTLAQHSPTHYIEISPHPVLLGMASDCVDGGIWLASLRERDGEWQTILGSLQSLYCAGAAIDWPGFYRGDARQRVGLPTYPFRRKRHWIDLNASDSVDAPNTTQRWDQLVDAMRRASDRGPLNLNASSYPAKWRVLERLTTACSIDTFRALGLFSRAGECHTTDGVLSAAGIAATYKHLMQRWLIRLADANLLEHRDDTFTSLAALPDPGLAGLWDEAEVLFEDNRPLLAYVQNCARILQPVLTGRESPLETLFPGGSFDLAQGLYERSSTMLYINDLASAALATLNANVAPGRVLKLMEIGAGTGGTSASLLPVFDPRRVRYRFTDVSDAFLTQARSRFGAYPSIEFGLYDLETDPQDQGYRAGSFDVLVSANCVHAAKDLRAALRRLLTLLAPGGLLVLVESTVHLAYFDMTTGLIEGWQHFADDLRTDNPLIGPELWTSALLTAGFAEARAWPGDESSAAALGQHVIIARAPGLGTSGSLALVGSLDSDSTESRHQADESSEAQTHQWLTRFTAAMPAEQLDILVELVRSEVTRVLRLDAIESPGRSDRLMDLGMDSLMAVQLRNGLTQALKLSRPLPSTLMFDYPTIGAVAEELLVRLVPQSSAATVAQVSMKSSGAASAPALGASVVAAMSDAEIEELLLKRLGTK